MLCTPAGASASSTTETTAPTWGASLWGVLVPEQEKEGWTEFLNALGYRHWDETNNPAYGLFL